MRKRLLLLCSLLLLTTAVWGAPVACSNGTLAGYTSLASGCTIAGVTFSNFGFTSSGSAAPLPAASDVTVNVIDSGSATGLEFIGPFGAAAGLSMDALISFVITAGAIGSETLSMQGYGQQGDGSVRVTESVCEGTLGASGACSGPVGSLDVFANSSGSQASQTINFAPVNSVAVTKNIIVQGGTRGTQSDAGVSAVFNTIPGGGGAGPGGGPVPEPGSLITLGSGLIVTALLLRTRLRKA